MTMSGSLMQDITKYLIQMSPEHQYRQACKLTQEGRPRRTDALLPDGYVLMDHALSNAPIDYSTAGVGTYTQPGLLGIVSASKLCS
jgi:hypothetical protein